jgi:hypothetical protein
MLKNCKLMKQYIVTVLATLFFTQAGIAQSTGTFTDSRDGQTYKTISFKEAFRWDSQVSGAFSVRLVRD